LVIVGGGVLGTMHAVAARRRGFEVVQLEREAEARGASVRNFGLVWVSGRRAGPELSLALRARELWSELGAKVPGLGFRAAGSLTLATSDAELSLLKEAATLPDAERVRAARRGGRPRGQPGAAWRLCRRAALPPRRDRRAPAGPPGAARVSRRPW
jgi:glycine/D-amino acid oxidase-like deaminating enzyme